MKQPTHPAGASGTGRRQVVLAVLGIVAAVLAAYFNSFAGVFVYDDEPAILLNPTIRDVWSFGQSLRPPADTTVSGRPVANLSFAINYALSGTRVWSYHATNLLIHVLASLTLFGVVRRTMARPWGPGPRPGSLGAGWNNARSDEATLLAFTVALLWGLHPLQTEAVTYVVQRVESLMALFFLLTFYGFIRSLNSPHPGRWRGLAIVACLLGMGTKEVTATAPVLLLLFDRTFVGGSFRRAWMERRGFYLALAATWIPLAMLVATTGWNRGGTVGFDVGVTPWAYWSTQFEAVVRYLRLAFWPYPLVFDYNPSVQRGLAEVLPDAGVVMALLAAVLWALRRRPVAGFLGAWFFVILAPTSVVPSAVQMIVEHRMYLPLVAVVVAVVSGAHLWLGRRGVYGLVGLAVGLGWATAQRNTVYRSEWAIWGDTVEKCPSNDRARNNLGNVLSREGDFAAAIEQYQAALRIRSDCAETHHNLANGLRQLGRPQEAVAHYEEALRLDPRRPDAHTALGIALEESGRGDEALAHYRQALQIDPQYAGAHNRLGVALAKAGRIPEAVVHYEAALRADPALAEVHNNLGNAFRATGRAREAIAEYEEALRLAPGLLAPRSNLGRLLAAMDRLPEAIVQYEQLLKFAPSSPEAHTELGMVLVMTGRAPDAIAHFEQALRLNPGLAQVHLYLAVALENVGRSAEAAAHLETARRMGVAVPEMRN